MANIEIRVAPTTADEDRVAHRVIGDVEVVVLSDGAGGVSGGREVAERIVQSEFGALRSPTDCVTELRRLDAELSDDRRCGEATVVLLVLRQDTFFGASVGDSGLWAFSPGGILDVTSRQNRKPFMGSGAAQPVAFGPSPFVHRLLAASDGLLKYASREVIRMAASLPDIVTAGESLISSVRLPSGGLQDDVALALIDPPALAGATR